MSFNDFKSLHMTNQSYWSISQPRHILFQAVPRLLPLQWSISLVKKWHDIPWNWCKSLGWDCLCFLIVKLLVSSIDFRRVRTRAVYRLPARSLFFAITNRYLCEFVIVWTNGSSLISISRLGNITIFHVKPVMTPTTRSWRMLSRQARTCVRFSRNQPSLLLLPKLSLWV
jgi:hypothetical protein